MLLRTLFFPGRNRHALESSECLKLPVVPQTSRGVSSAVGKNVVELDTPGICSNPASTILVTSASFVMFLFSSSSPRSCMHNQRHKAVDTQYFSVSMPNTQYFSVSIHGNTTKHNTSLQNRLSYAALLCRCSKCGALLSTSNGRYALAAAIQGTITLTKT